MAKPKIAVLGIDLGKNSCSVAGLVEVGRVVLRRRLTREGVVRLTAEFLARVREDQAARRLATIPGFGALNATALIAAIGTGETFGRARDLAAWLGLVPRQATTGGKPRLLGITKRGNTEAEVDPVWWSPLTLSQKARQDAEDTPAVFP